jgi:hypothetical protein
MDVGQWQMAKFKVLIRSFALLAALAGEARAEDVVALAQRAKQQAAAGQNLEALQTLREAYFEVADKMPLGFRRSVFVAEKAPGFGMMKPRADNVFRPGEVILIYAEPVGFGWRKTDGVYNSVMTADFEIQTPEGKILGGQKKFGRFALSGQDRNTEYMVHLTYNVSGLSEGEYVVSTVLHDEVSGKISTLNMNFVIRK